VADVYNVYKNEDLAREALDLADQLKIEYPEYGEDIEDLLMKGLRPEDIRTQITQKRERKRRQSELATQYPDFAKDVDKLFGEGFSPEEVTSRMEAMAGAKARIEQRNQEALDRKSAETYAKEIEAQQARTREILSTAGIEAGPSASRVGELTRQIEVGRAAGQDISDLERERRLIQAYGIQGLPIVARISALRRRLSTAPESERADIQFLINSLQRGLGGATTEQVATAQLTPGEALTQQLYGQARGAVTGATLGAARPLFERAEEATGGVVPRQGIGETAAEAIGGLATGVVGAGALAPSVSGLYAGLGGVGAQAATRGTIGGIQSGVQTAISLAQGADISPTDAAVNIGQGILSSALSVPIAAKVPGVKLNAAAQVAGDFVVDLAADVGYRDRLKDQSFVDWLLKEELPNLAVSIAGAGKDVLDAWAAKTEIRRLFDQRMRSGAATPPPPTRAEPAEPELATRPTVETETPAPARDFVLDPVTGRPVETERVGTTDDLFKIKLKSLGYSDDEAARALAEFRNRGDTDSDIEENIKDIEYAQQQASATSEARRKEATETARRAREDVEFRRRQIEERAVEPTPRPEPAPKPEPLPPARPSGPVTEFTSADDLRAKLQEKIAGATNKRQAIKEDARYYGVSTNGKTAQQVVDEIVVAATKAPEPTPIQSKPIAEAPTQAPSVTAVDSPVDLPRNTDLMSKAGVAAANRYVIENQGIKVGDTITSKSYKETLTVDSINNDGSINVTTSTGRRMTITALADGDRFSGYKSLYTVKSRASESVTEAPAPRPPVAEEPAARPVPEEKIPGTRAIAQRIENAENKFVEFAMESAGLTREQAVKALESYKKAKAIKIDPIGGQFSFKHGGFAEADVLRRAAGLGDVVAPVARVEQPSARALRPEEPAPEAGKKARGFSSYKREGLTPIIDYINDEGGLLPRSKLRNKQGGEYDAAPSVSELGGFGRAVYGGSIPADEMATMLYNTGLIDDASPDLMFSKIRSEINSYRQNRSRNAEMEQQDKLASKQSKAFQRDAVSKPKEKEPVNTASLNVGDEVKIGGESFKVREIDPDTNAVVLEDGEKYGVQIVEDGVTIYGKVEKKAPQAGGESPFGEGLRLESQTPEQVASERARSEQRAEIERRQAEPMRGKPLDTTADIFGEGETPLFNQRRAEAAAAQPQRLEDIDLGNLRAEIDAIASYQGKQKRLNELAEQFGVPTGGTPKEILGRIEEAYNAAKERQVAEGGVREYRGDGARVQEEGQDRIVTPEVQEGRPEAGGGYRPAPSGNVPPGPVGRGVQGEEVAPAAGPERRATFYMGKSGRVDVTFPDEKSKNAYSAWRPKRGLDALGNYKYDSSRRKQLFDDLKVTESTENRMLFQEYVEYVKEQASEAARNKSGSVDVMSVEDWFRSKGVAPVAEPDAGPKYMRDRAQAVERAKQLGLDAEGTTSEIVARVSKKEKVISFFDEMEKSARVRLEELRKGGTLGAQKPVGIAAEYLIIGTAKFGKGVTEFGAWSAEMVKEFGSQVKPYLRQLFNSSKSAARREYGSQDEAIEYINTLSSDLKIEKVAKGVEPSTREILPEGEEISRVVEKPAREVGLRNELGDAERREFKFADLPEVESKSVDVEWNKSAKKIQEDPGYGERLTDELGKNPGRPMSEEDSAVMLRYKRMLASEIDAASEAMSKARSSEEMADATARFERATDKYESVVNAAKNAGTVWGRTGVWRQMVAAEDYSLARMVTKARAANNGSELTPERRDEVVRQSEKIKSLQKKVDEIEEAGGAAGVGGAIKAEVDAIKTGKVTPPEAEPVVNPNKIASSIKELARYFVSRGVTDRTKLIEEIHRVVSKVDPEITIRDVRDSFTDYGKFSPISKEELDVKLRDLRQQLQQISKLEDMEAGRAPRKTGQERQSPSDEGRRLIKMVNEAKKKGGYDVTDPARQLASAMQAVKTRLTNQIADLEYQIREKRKIIKEKKGIEYDAEALALQKRRDELKAEYDNVFGKPELTDEQRVARAMSAVTRSIEDLTRRIKSGDLFPEKTKKVPPESPELVARMAERDALREQLKELQLIARPEISLQSYKTRVKNQIAEIQRKIAAGDFSAKPKKKMEMDEEASRLYYELDKAKQDFNKSLIEDRWRNYSAGKKVWETTKDISSNLTRALITSIDLPVARQGLFTLVTRPVTSISAIPSTLKAMVSKEQHFRVMDEIRRRPSYKAMKAAGLEITEPESANIMKQEESFRGRLIEKMPRWIGGGLVRGSQRAYEAFLNKVRADVFDSMSKTLAKGGAPTDKELKLIANMINVATGRGSLSPQNAQKLAGASSVFFAPRYAVSRFQLALGQPLLTSLGDVGWKDTSRARKIIASEYAKFLGGAAAFYSLIEMRNQLVDEDEQWSVEKDPRSSDFGKVKVGNTRIDPLGGLSQVTVFLSKLATGESKSAQGDVRVLREAGRPLNLFRRDSDPMKTAELEFGKSDIRGLVKDFLERKLAPTVTIPMNIASQQRMFERKGESAGYGPLKLAQDLVVPLSVRDIYEAMLDQGVPAATAYAMLAFFGLSTQTYKIEEKKERETKSELPGLKNLSGGLKTIK